MQLGPLGSRPLLACEGLRPISAGVSLREDSSKVELLSELASPSLHEPGNLSNCPVCFLDLSSIPLKSGMKH